MTALTPVLHLGQIAGSSVRFFRSPLHGPDFPWHSVDDLHAALGFPRDLRRHFKAKLQGSWANDVRTVATDGAVVTIAPHWMAQGMLSAAEEVGCGPYSAGADYARSGAAALSIVTAPLSPEAGVAYAVAAYKRGADQ